MDKVLAYYPLHYGKRYFARSLASIYDCVDKIIILYTANPSYGFKDTEMANPDTEEALKECAKPFMEKIEWRTVWADSEGQHRRVAEDLAETLEYPIILAVDSDEIWDKASLQEAISWVSEHQNRNYRVPFVHYFRDEHHVCTDQAQPHRLTKTNGVVSLGDSYIPLSKPVKHYGYAISDELMKYKWQIHGHKNELRPEWLEEVWLSRSDNHPDGVHPTNREGFWVPKKVSKDV